MNTAATPTGPRRPGRDDVCGALAALWPGHEVRATTSLRPEAADIVLTALPSVDSPVVLLPRAPGRVVSSALRHTRGTQGLAAAVQGVLLDVAARSGVFRLFPHRFLISGQGTAGIDRHLRAALGRDLFVSMYVGPVRAGQKPVLQLVSPEGQTFAFVKIGINDFTRALVTHEANALRDLEQARPAAFDVPTVLYVGRWEGHVVLVQEALLGTEHRGPDEKMLAHALRELASLWPVEEHTLGQSQFWARVARRVTALPSSANATRLASASRVVAEDLGGRQPRWGAWHTDFAPWNMAVRGGRLLIWDWEQLERSVPAGFDAVHYVLNTNVVVRGADTLDSVSTLGDDARTLLLECGVPEHDHALVVLLYVIELASRYLRDGESGTRLSRLDDWLPSVLPELLERAKAGQVPRG